MLTEVTERQVGQLTSIAHAIICIYLLGMVAMGLWFARAHGSCADYE